MKAAKALGRAGRSARGGLRVAAAFPPPSSFTAAEVLGLDGRSIGARELMTASRYDGTAASASYSGDKSRGIGHMVFPPDADEMPELDVEGSDEESMITAELLSKSIGVVRRRFLESQRDIIGDLNSEIAESGLDRSSVEVGHKIIAARTTLLPRLYLDLELAFKDPLAYLKSKVGEKSVRERIKQNSTLLRYTGHPTEGQNLLAVTTKDLLVDLSTLLSIVRHLKDADPSLLTELMPEISARLGGIAREFGIKDDVLAEFIAEERAPTFEEFEEVAANIRSAMIKDFVARPLHHTEKMTVEQEREMLIYHATRCRKHMAGLAARYEEIEVDDIKATTWGCDMDGKPHVTSGDGVIFEYASQQSFFEVLYKTLLEKADELTMNRLDVEEFREKVLDLVERIIGESEGNLLLGDESKESAKSILTAIEEFEETLEEEINFEEVKNFIRNSDCKVMSNGFSTREEIDKTRTAFTEAVVFYLAEKPELSDEIAVDLEKPEFDMEDINKMASYVIRNSGDEEMMRIIASQFAEKTPDTKRQLMMMMEAAVLHPKHEHVISQFSCEVADEKAVIALFEIAKHLPKYHREIPHFAEYYAARSEEAGFDIAEQLFSDTAQERAAVAMLEPSPLAETRDTTDRIIGFTAEMLADPDIVDYIRRSGGTVRQTRSKSDGSAASGPDEITIRYLEADFAVAKMVKDAGFKFSRLNGIGANDIERMAPWDLSLLMDSEEEMEDGITVQGGDAQHQTANRLLYLLLRDKDRSKEAWPEFMEKYEGREDEIGELLEFYYQSHQRSEEGIDVEIDSRVTKSGFLTHRGSIPGEVVGFLNRLSSRPGGRKGDTKSEVTRNETDKWHEVVYNPDMRRIGAISLQRATGFPTFVTAPRSRDPILAGFDTEMVADFQTIPAINNNNVSAIFALGCIDPRVFLLTNGINLEDIEEETLAENAANYAKLLDLRAEDRLDELEELAIEVGFDTPEGMRFGHLSYQLEGARHVLRNSISPLLRDCNPATKASLEIIFTEAEEGIVKDYGPLVQGALELVVSDPAIDLDFKKTLACVSQQVENIRRPGNFYDTRFDLTKQAHEALEIRDEDEFKKSCEWLAIIMRSAGNPLSPGQKTHEIFKRTRDTAIAKSPTMASVIVQEEAMRRANVPKFEFASRGVGVEDVSAGDWGRV